MTHPYSIPLLPLPYDLETRAVLKQAAAAHRFLAELKGVAQTIPNEHILISTLTLQEALDSSAIENIVTTSDDLYKADLDLEGQISQAAAKEVIRYREAMMVGFDLVRRDQLITLNDIITIQGVLVQNSAGFRRVPGTVLKSSRGDVVYTPPQDHAEILRLMANLEQYINDTGMHDLDPLVKLAVIHHQFESIHPFLDGNGRTGRILSVLYLITRGLLDMPILYLSRYITHHKGDYYRLIQNIRDHAPYNATDWEAWILFMLRGVETTARDTIELVKQISQLMAEYKQILRPLFGPQYKHELLNNLFSHPYTKIEYMKEEMNVARKTAAKYLDKIVDVGLLKKVKQGRSNYYINERLVALFLAQSLINRDTDETIESVQESRGEDGEV